MADELKSEKEFVEGLVAKARDMGIPSTFTRSQKPPYGENFLVDIELALERTKTERYDTGRIEGQGRKRRYFVEEVRKYAAGRGLNVEIPDNAEPEDILAALYRAVALEKKEEKL